MYGLRRGDIPTGGNLTKVSTYSNSNDTTIHKQHGVRHTLNSADNTQNGNTRRAARSSPLSTNAVRVLATKCATQRASSCVETDPIPCGVAREAAPREAETRRAAHSARAAAPMGSALDGAGPLEMSEFHLERHRSHPLGQLTGGVLGRHVGSRHQQQFGHVGPIEQAGHM